VKDVWVYPLASSARSQLQEETPPPLTPICLCQSLDQNDWIEMEWEALDLGDRRRNKLARAILQARWDQPQASFYGSFSGWTPTKGAYDLIEHKSPDISLRSLLAPHQEQTLARMAAEPVLLLPEDTATLNFSGLRCTTGLGPLGEEKGQGLWLHRMLAFRPDGVPLGLVDVQCWARPPQPESAPGRNALSLDAVN
jgi:hypothetical protein